MLWRFMWSAMNVEVPSIPPFFSEMSDSFERLCMEEVGVLFHFDRPGCPGPFGAAFDFEMI